MVGILLAAGQSRRFDSNKLLHPMKHDVPMAIVTAKILCAALPNCIAVINPSMTELKIQFEQLGIQVLINHTAENGIGNSIACGIHASQQATGWIITLADMPYIKTETILLIANELSTGTGIVAPTYQQKRGHPVGFEQRYRNELLQLNSDIGARSIIARHHDELQLMETNDPGVILDIDTSADLVQSSEYNL